MKLKHCTGLLLCTLLTACAGGPSNADISKSVTAYTKDKINAGVSTATTLGGSRGRNMALQISGLPDPDTLPDFVCEKDNMSKADNGDYTGKIHCSNPKIDGGKVKYADITITQTGDTWTTKNMQTIN